MSINTDWDVEKHKVDYECDEHWELRKRFLETHKDKFPEDELVCLAQVFTNVELLGCRYPKETMDLIAELSEDVARDYRVKQKTKLQRTFVKASDAASSKIKGHGAPPQYSSSPVTLFPSTCQNSDSMSHEIEQKLCKRARLDNERPFGNLVLLQYPNQNAQAIIECSVAVSGMKIEWKYQSDVDNQCRCKISIDGKQLSESVGKSKKFAKREATQKGLELLQKYYYLIEVKEHWKQNLNSNTDFNEKLRGGTKKIGEINKKECLGEDNIGAKLMKLMGWAGGGLGRSQQGITEPITVTRRISRKGFGVTLNQSDKNQFKTKFRETLHQYIRDGSKNDLVFSDFDNEERALMHQIARQIGLKSHSYGGKDQRTLLISRKIDPRDLIEELLNLGGSTDKYVLKAPTGS